MARRKNDAFAQINAIGSGSFLEAEIAERMKAAGISYADQNAWFWRREFEGKMVGCEIREENGITVFYCSDFLANYLNTKFSEHLFRAFKNKWRLVGTSSGRHISSIHNPTYPAPKDETKSDLDVIGLLRSSLSAHKKWIAENHKSIIHFHYVNQVSETLQNLIEWKEKKLRAA